MTSCGCSGAYKKGNRPGRKRHTPPQGPKESASAGIAQKTSMPFFVIHKGVYLVYIKVKNTPFGVVAFSYADLFSLYYKNFYV
jgi:hypothetical protein